MAGAGYRLFNTGDVLTAAQVNTFLMEQTVMVFADAAARTTALTGVVSEGMISYLRSTKQVEVYNGTSWVASDDPNAIQNTIVDAKGDLITATAADTPARLAVGSNGDTLVADSAATTGLRWQGNYAAGKNKIINGAFDIWQRGTTQNLTTNNGFFLADRFISIVAFSAGTASISRQTFTPGTAPVSGYEGQYFYRLNTGTTATYFEIKQHIEDVRTLAGQNITISFWAKASSNVTVKNLIRQDFGTGGSANVDNTANFNLTTSWQRFTRSIEPLGSMSGKTIGSNSKLSFFIYQDTGALGGLDIDLWGVQVEAGSVATAFQTATGTLQGELAAASRYYQRFNFGAEATAPFIAWGVTNSSTVAYVGGTFNTQMRVKPSAIDYTANLVVSDGTNAATATALALESNFCTQQGFFLNVTSSGLTQYRPVYLRASSSSYVGFSAEL